MGWFTSGKQEPAPPKCPGNPGVGVEAKVAFTNGSRRWTEQVDVVEQTAAILQGRGHEVVRHKGWLTHRESGFQLQPLLAHFEPLEDGGVRTVTTIQVNHPQFAPDGLFEYQHSAGDGLVAAIAQGIDQWIQLDFVPLLEALRPKPAQCTCMEMRFPEQEGNPAHVRRVIFGPIMHYMQTPPPEPVCGEGDDHCFCPCCLFTRSAEAFHPLITSNMTCALRLFASRDENGEPQADCRVNGEDFEPGAKALQNYATSWPPAGYEFRKQYVILHSM